MMNPSAEASIIRASHLGKVFQTDEIETHALSDIHLNIDRGEFVAITGPSGCGKSTLLSIIGLLDKPSSGAYALDGQDVASLDGRSRARFRNSQIGFIFQAFNLISDLTVEENVALPLTYRDDYSKADAARKVGKVLEIVGMAHRQRHYPTQLSGGQQQRIAVARALVVDPKVLLADEPTGNLDSKNGEAVMKLLEQLHAGGTTICMVTHDTTFARRANRMIYMLDGRIVDEEAFERLRHDKNFTQGILSEASV